MRAAVLYGKEDVRVEEVPSPPLKPGEIRISIQAALTCGTDLKVFRRGYHAKMIIPPALFGHEVAGIVSEVGDGAADWRVGERVVVANSAPCGECFYCHHGQENLCDDLQFLNGAYAESIVVPARLVEKNLHKIPPSMTFQDAALMEPFACVVQGVNDLEIAANDRALIIGAGPIGLMFAALLRSVGAAVCVAGRGENRLRKAEQFGCEPIDVAATDLVSAVKERRRTFDVVVEAVGKPETWEASVQLVRKGGRVNFFGGCPSGTFVKLNTALIHYSNLKLLASFHHTPRTTRQALEFIGQGVISARDFVDGECPLSRLPELFKSMAQGNRAVKTLIQVAN